MSATVTPLQCLLCGRHAHDALTICNAAVCRECERLVVTSHPQDPEYEHFVQRFRIFWEGLAEAAASRE